MCVCVGGCGCMCVRACERACVCACVGTLIEAVVGATGCAARDATYAGRAIWISACVCARARVVREG